MADAIEFLPHDLGQSLQPFLNLSVVQFEMVYFFVAVALPSLVRDDGGLRMLLRIPIFDSLFFVNELNVQRQFAEYLLEEGFPEVDLHEFGLRLVPQPRRVS